MLTPLCSPLTGHESTLFPRRPLGHLVAWSQDRPLKLSIPLNHFFLQKTSPVGKMDLTARKSLSHHEPELMHHFREL
jgi:hypothetical protein